jgi:hypothetical protein
MRSIAAIAPCMTAYLADRSRIGMKNLLMYSRNATTRPRVTIASALTPRWATAHHATAATAITPIASTSAYIAASARIDARYASRWPALMTSYSRAAASSRRKICTTLMPLRCS